jgi:hypothetical protein
VDEAETALGSLPEGLKDELERRIKKDQRYMQSSYAAAVATDKTDNEDCCARCSITH